jgi:pilus assembly protein CpaB
MNRQYRTVIVMAIAVATAALASFGVYTALQRMPVREVEVGTVNVVVAAEPLDVGTQLRREQLKVVAWPAKTQVPGAFSDPNDVIDRGVIETINVNEPVTNRKVASKEQGAGLSPIIPQGMRALSIRVNDVISVAGYVVPGTRVDVLVTVSGQQATGNEPMSRTVVSNLLVLTAGTRYDTEKSKDGKPQPVAVVTLAVVPEDAEKIALAQNQGTLSLALRNPLDVDPTKTNGMKMANLMRGGLTPEPVVNPETRKVVARKPAPVPPPAPVVAAPPPPPIYRVETIRGAKRTEEIVN